MTGASCVVQRPAGFSWGRLAGFTFGLGVQALFVVTVVYLYAFLRWGAMASAADWFWIDLLLALQFVIPHSILLHPRFRDIFRRWFPSEFHGAFFCLATCASLLLMFGCWRTAPSIIWELDGTAGAVVLGCFHLSWAALLYSISLTGLGYQTGLTQWKSWYQGVKQGRREFRAQSLYRVLRHPVYLSFLGLIWFTPVMTADHGVLTVVWTAYIFAGSILKDERLLYYLGDSYAEYMSRVAGYPGILAGPLGRRPLPEARPAASEAAAGSVAGGIRAA